MPAPVKEPKPYSRVPVWQWCGSAHPLRGAKWPQAGRGGDSGDGRRLGLLEASAFGNGISSPFKFCGLFCSATELPNKYHELHDKKRLQELKPVGEPGNKLVNASRHENTRALVELQGGSRGLAAPVPGRTQCSRCSHAATSLKAGGRTAVGNI